MGVAACRPHVGNRHVKREQLLDGQVVCNAPAGHVVLERKQGGLFALKAEERQIADAHEHFRVACGAVAGEFRSLLHRLHDDPAQPLFVLGSVAVVERRIVGRNKPNDDGRVDESNA